MKGCIIHIRGLGDTDVNGNWCGARVHVGTLAMQLGLYVVSANWNDKDAMLLIDHAREQGMQSVALTGHSHGAWRAGEIAGRYGPEAFDYLALLDYCPFLNPAAQLGPPLLFPLAARAGFAVWQHNSMPTGCKFFSSNLRVECEDATVWREPKLGHIDFPEFGMSSIAGDTRVWSAIGAGISTALNERNATLPPPTQAVAPIPSGAAVGGGAL